MANANQPRGLKVYGNLLSCKMVKMSTAYAQDLFIGDPIARDSSGNGIIATAGTGNAIFGAAIGFFTSDFVPLTYSYHPSATAGTNFVLVADDPRQLFVMQEDSVGSNLALTDLAGNAVLAAGSGGSTTSGWSSWMIDSSGGGDSTAGDQVRLMDILRQPDNAVGAYCKWIVRINNHQGLQGIVGVGI